MKQEARRTMSEALRTVELPAEAIAVIKEGALKSRAAASGLVSPPTAPQLASEESTNLDGDDVALSGANSHPALSEPESSWTPRSTGARTAKAKPSRDVEPEPTTLPASVSVTVRVPADIPTKLLRAATDRKIARLRPFTQQEIVAEALAYWLKKNGY